MAGREIWFEYAQVGRRLKARPVHWKGWAVLLALCVAPGSGVMAMVLWRPPISPGYVLGYMLVSMVLVFSALTVLIRTRGRQRK